MRSITSNPDSLSKGKSILIYDTMDCLQEKFDKLLSIVLKKLKNISDTYIFSFKLDVLKLLIESTSNLVNVIHFEELEGFIKKASKKTYLISSENAIKIQEYLFKFFKKLNDFGNRFYNFGPKIALNVTINPGNLEVNLDGEIAILDLDDRGIKVHLHSNFLFRTTGAYSLQTVVFDSPLVSIRGKRIKERGTSNTFIGITLYDKNGNEIFVKDINIDIFKPIIYFKKKLFKSMTTCLHYNDKSKSMEDTGIRSEIQNLDGEEYIKCIPHHLNIFTIGSYEKAEIIDSSQNIFDKIINLSKIVIICIIFFLLIICCCCICCSSKKS